MKIYHLLNIAAALCLASWAANAQSQQPQTPEQQEKQLLEYVDKEVKRLSSLLDLEYWQEFYVDSTLTHDMKARMNELQDLQKAKVENTDLYMTISDKWMARIDSTYKTFFTKEQWDKYWKNTGKRAQREREKRKKK